MLLLTLETVLTLTLWETFLCMCVHINMCVLQCKCRSQRTTSGAWLWACLRSSFFIVFPLCVQYYLAQELLEILLSIFYLLVGTLEFQMIVLCFWLLYELWMFKFKFSYLCRKYFYPVIHLPNPCFVPVLMINPRAPCVLDTHSTTDLYLQTKKYFCRWANSLIPR